MKEDPDLISVSDIRDIAGVKSAAVVSNWRRRHPDFPHPVAQTSGARDLFDRREVESWLRQHRKVDEALPRHRGDQTRFLESERDPATAVRTALGVVAVFVAVEDLVGRVAADEDRASSAVREAIARVDNDAVRNAIEYAVGRDDDLLVRTCRSVAQLWASTTAPRLYEELLRARQRSSRLDESLPYRTDPRLASLMTSVVVDPQAVQAIDPAAGEGALLIELASRMPRIAVTGIEKDEATWVVAVLRTFVHRLRVDDIVYGDSFLAPPQPYDVVVCDPPVGVRVTKDVADRHNRERVGDPLWHTVWADRDADAAWLLHASELVSDTGRAAVLQPITSLTRPGAFQLVRHHLAVTRCAIEAVIVVDGVRGRVGGAPLAIWVLNGAGDQSRILFVDAVGETADQSIKDLVRRWRTPAAAFEDVPGFAVAVSIADVVADGVSLVPSRWTRTSDPVELSGQARGALADLREAHDELRRRDNADDTGLDVLPTVTVIDRRSVGDLIDEGHLLAIPGVRSHDQAAPGLPVVDPSWFDAGDAPIRADAGTLQQNAVWAHPRVSQPGDVIVYTGPGDVRAAVTAHGGFLVSPRMQVWRIQDYDRQRVVTPRVLAALLRDPSIVRYATGSTIKHVNLRTVQIPILDSASLAALDRALEQLEGLEENAARVLRNIGTYTGALLATLTADPIS